MGMTSSPRDYQPDQQEATTHATIVRNKRSYYMLA
jgi:hypothetical protein